MKATLVHLEKVLKASFQDAKRLKILTKTFESGRSLNHDWRCNQMACKKSGKKGGRC